MKQYKIYGILLALTPTLILLFHAVIWHGFTHKFLAVPEGYYVGNLARIGYISDYIDKRKQEVTLPRTHKQLAEWQGEPVDILTIGDSFSYAKGLGKNPSYQDFLTNDHNLSVLHMITEDKISFQEIIALTNSGFFDIVKPKYLLLESIQNLTIKRFAKTFDFGERGSLPAFRKKYLPKSHRHKHRDIFKSSETIAFMNEGNLKFALFSFGRLVSPNAFVSRIYDVELTRSLFSVGDGKRLLFMRDSLEEQERYTPNRLSRINANLNRLQQLLADHGIKLLFMVAPDKYELYHPYIKENPFPTTPYFERFRKMEKAYTFIDSEKILREKIAAGEKDIYYADDSHWTAKAGEAVSTEISKQIRNNNFL